jgi:glycosyltransferase involved in cell wall biosynthesis
MIYHAAARADAYIALTDFEANYVSKRGMDPGRVSTIGVGVDPAPFQAISRAEARQRYGLGPEPLIGFIGQFAGHKGVDALIKAMPAIWKRKPETQFLLAGARTNFSDQYEAMIQALPPSDREKVRIIYNFKEDEKPFLFAALDVFAYPSGYESFGIAFIEAWSASKPVVGCFRGAIPYLVTGGVDGLLVEHNNPPMLAEALLYLLCYPEWAREMGEAGHRKVLQRYTWERVARRFRGVYQDAIEHPRFEKSTTATIRRSA